MCKIYKILYAVLPIKKWKDALIRRHFERCSSCVEEVERISKAAGALFRPDWIQDTANLWPQIRHKIAFSEKRTERVLPEIGRGRFRLRKWGWAGASAAFLILGAIGFFILRHHDRSIPAPGLAPAQVPAALIPRVQVISAEIGGKPAKPYIYQTPAASFIWLAPSKNIGG
jgi:hypothetical protein